jgi:preprotein translocase subunit SecF
MFIVTRKKFFLILSSLFMLGSIAAVFTFGLNFGIDFKGGSIIEIEYADTRPEPDMLHKALGPVGYADALVQATNERGYIIRTEALDDEAHESLITILKDTGAFTEKRFNSIGAVIGKELGQKAILALVLTLLAIILYIAYAFRKVSEPVSSWKYGLIAIVALIHNTIVPIGMFAALGAYSPQYQVDILFVTALLAIFGFSVNDTIVIFDRVRENLRKNTETRAHRPFSEVVGRSIAETLTRSINISVAILLVVACLYLFGSASTKEFSLVLSLGVIFGTYSSICFAAPLLVAVEKWQNK